MSDSSGCEPIHVVLAVYDPSGRYSQHAGVVMTSLFENTNSKVIVHVLHDETLTNENRQKLIRTAEKYSQSVDIIDITEYKNNLDERLKTHTGQYTVGTLYRLFIPEILPDVEKVIYLDCDIIVNMDIRELWDVDLEGCHIAGVIHDPAEVGISETVRLWLCGLSLKTYINAGVLLMDLTKIREEGDLVQNSMNWFNYHLMRMGDQDILNGLFKNSIKFIDRRFNNMQSTDEREIAGTIIHASGLYRAWVITGHNYQVLYWQTYMRSAWGEGKTSDELIETISSYYEYKRDRYQAVFDRVRPTLMKMRQTIAAIEYPFKHIVLKIKQAVHLFKHPRQH